MNNDLVKTTIDHIEWLAGRLRPEHVREVEGLSIGAAGKQLAESFALSRASLCGIRNGRPVYAMGILPAKVIGRHARVWMLGTSEIDLYPVWVFKTVRKGIAYGFEATEAEAISAWVPEWYTVGLNFLGRLGFRPIMDMPLGCFGDTHYLMTKTRKRSYGRGGDQ